MQLIRALAGLAFVCIVVASGGEMAAADRDSEARLTLAAFPTTADWNALVSFRGSLSDAGPGAFVEVQAKECGIQPVRFRAVAGGETDALGTWEAQGRLERNALVRAVWNDEVSVEIAVKQRVAVGLHRLRSGGWRVSVTAGTQYWRKRAQIQARRGGGWTTVKSVVLTDTEAEDPTGRRSSVWSHAEFKLRVARGTLLRAVFPKSQAGACHAAGVSTTRRA